MQIQVSKLTDVSLLRKACGFTIDRESKIGLDSIYRCEHSPARTQMFCVEMRNIATFVSVHMVRHKVGVEHFVKSNREDRLGYSGDLGRHQPVNHMMIANAQALIQMARKRLCCQAHVATQEVMEAIKQEVAKVDPDLARYMVPECEYRNGYCPELKPCGRNLPPRDCKEATVKDSLTVGGTCKQSLQVAPVAGTGEVTPFAFYPMQEIMAEVNRATAKYPKWPTDPLHALAVLGEEYGELNKGLLQLCYEPHKTNKAEVRAEAIQTAAMALRLIVSLDRYEYREGAQHKQGNNIMDCAGIRCDQCDKKAACSVK